MGILFILMALFLHFSKHLPNVKNNSNVASSPKANKLLITLTLIMIVLSVLSIIKSIQTNEFLSTIILFILLFSIIYIIAKPLFIKKKTLKDWGAMKYPQLTLGMLAIFTYVGVEVTIQSTLLHFKPFFAQKIPFLQKKSMKIG